MSSERIDVVNGLRGIAILAVMFHHLFARAFEDSGPLIGAILTNGWLGVDLFFILSGFVLYLPIERGATATAKRFYARRIRRLAPLFYWVAISSTVIIVVLCGARLDAGFAMQSVVLFSGLFTLHPTTFFPQANWVFWSLGVEFLFCAAFPLLVVTRERLLPITLAAMLLCPVLRAAGYAIGHGQYLDWISASAPARLDEFLLGMLVARLYVRGRLPDASLTLLALGSAMLFLAGLLFYIWFGGRLPRYVAGGILSLASAGLTLILVGALQSAGTMRRILAWPPLQVVGMMCYSIYAWHGILLLAMFRTTNLDAIPTSSLLLVLYVILVAIISYTTYRFVEFHYVKEWRGLFHPAPAPSPSSAQ